MDTSPPVAAASAAVGAGGGGGGHGGHGGPGHYKHHRGGEHLHDPPPPPSDRENHHQGHHGGDADGRPNKRQKIRLACQECRDRKIRCDGARPICNTCMRKRLGPDKCIYAIPEPDITVQHVRALEARIHELEARLEEEERQHNPQPPPGYANQSSATSRSPSQANQSTPVTIPSLLSSGASYPNYPGHRSGSNGQSTPSYYNRQLPVFPPPLSPIEPAISVPRSSGLDSPGYGRHEYDQSAPPFSRYRPPPIKEQLVKEGDPDVGILEVAGAMGATTTAHNRNVNSGVPVFLGKSSAAAFINEVSQSATESSLGSKTPTTQSMTSHAHALLDQNDAALAGIMDKITLPSRAVGDKLLKSYWDWVNSLYPIFHKPTFARRYEMLWMNDLSLLLEELGSITNVQTFYCLVNIIFALGARFNAPRLDSADRDNADTFFNRSRALMNLDLVDRASLQLVQVFILTAQYLQSSDLVNRCWVMTSIAVRTAQGLGIHIDLSHESQAQRQERRRTWHTCVLMDRVLSMTFGRPMIMLHPSQVPNPAVVDDEDLSTEPGSAYKQLPIKEVGEVEFFVQALRLSELLVKVITEFYYPPSPEAREMDADAKRVKDFNAVFDIDCELSHWKKSLPWYLQYENKQTDEASSNPLYRRQAVILQCRYMHLRILLFRPTVIRLAKEGVLQQNNSSITDLHRIMGLGCVKCYVDTAIEAIHTLHSKSGTQQLPPWWYSVFYLFSAGTVMLAVFRIPALRDSDVVDLPAVQFALDLCIESIQMYERLGVPFAKTCVESLRRVYEECRATDALSGGQADDNDGGATATTNTTTTHNPNHTNIATLDPTSSTSTSTSTWPTNTHPHHQTPYDLPPTSHQHHQQHAQPPHLFPPSIADPTTNNIFVAQSLVGSEFLSPGNQPPPPFAPDNPAPDISAHTWWPIDYSMDWLHGVPTGEAIGGLLPPAFVVGGGMGKGNSASAAGAAAAAVGVGEERQQGREQGRGGADAGAAGGGAGAGGRRSPAAGGLGGGYAGLFGS